MPFVMCKKDWPGTLRVARMQKQKKGPPVVAGYMDFEPGVPVNLTAAQVAEVEYDIGKGLLPIMVDPETMQITIVPMDQVDLQATAGTDAAS